MKRVLIDDSITVESKNIFDLKSIRFNNPIKINNSHKTIIPYITEFIDYDIYIYSNIINDWIFYVDTSSLNKVKNLKLRNEKIHLKDWELKEVLSIYEQNICTCEPNRREMNMAISNRELLELASNRINSKFGIKNYIQEAIVKGGSDILRNRYGEEISIYNNLYDAHEWIKLYDEKFEKRSKNDNGFLNKTRFLINLPDHNTFCFITVGNFGDSFLIINNNNDNKNNEIKIYVFGKYYKKYADELKNKITRKDSSELYIYDIKGYSSDRKEDGIDSVGRVMHKRDINSLYYNFGIKETIFNHIDSFFENRELYDSRDLTYKTGILLHGEPGTGKTSLATALATKYNRNLIVIDLPSFVNLDIHTLTSCINADSDKFIILLEDIDTIFPNLDREAGDLSETERKTVNKMLQFLDSSSSPNDVIFIATTNHYDKLDKAILRDGRFDLKVEIGLITENTAMEMIKSFNIDDKGMDEILRKMDESENTKMMHDNVLHKTLKRYNPSELQNKILSHFKDERRIENV